ncbi:hypothetical protein BJX62DRAFT_201007, partial [Aspergillus germanicus]
MRLFSPKPEASSSALSCDHACRRWHSHNTYSGWPSEIRQRTGPREKIIKRTSKYAVDLERQPAVTGTFAFPLAGGWWGLSQLPIRGLPDI